MLVLYQLDMFLWLPLLSRIMFSSSKLKLKIVSIAALNFDLQVNRWLEFHLIDNATFGLTLISFLGHAAAAEVMGHNWKAYNTCDALYSEQEYSPAVTQLRIILKTVLYVIKWGLIILQSYRSYHFMYIEPIEHVQSHWCILYSSKLKSGSRKYFSLCPMCVASCCFSPWCVLHKICVQELTKSWICWDWLWSKLNWSEMWSLKA